MCNWPQNPDGPNVCENHPLGPVPSAYHPECFLFGSNKLNFGGLDGLGCGHGCRSCMDNPPEILDGSIYYGRSKAGGAGLPLVASDNGSWSAFGQWGNPRSLYPDLNNSPNLAVTADNKARLLYAHTPMLIKQAAIFILGCCHDNFGQECYGTYSTCDCWKLSEGEGGNDTDPESGENPGSWVDPCPVPVLNPMNGMWPDMIFNMGIGWPPSAGTLESFANDLTMYCRRFTEADNCSQQVRAWSVSPTTAEHLFPLQLRMGNRKAHDGNSEYFGCSPSLLIWFLGTAAASAGCLDGYCCNVAENDNVGTRYSDGSTCDDAANQIKLTPQVVDPPRVAGSGVREDIINTALASIWTTDWPDPFQPGLSMNFDFIDALSAANANNPNLGHYSRVYNPVGITDDGELNSIYELPNSHARWGDMQFNISVVVPYIEVDVWFWVVSERQRGIGLPISTWTDNVLPYASIHIKMDLVPRINFVTGIQAITRPWTGEVIPITLTTGGIPNFPTITPDGNRIIYKTINDEEVEIPPLIEWRGQLGGLTNPSTPTFRTEWDKNGTFEKLSWLDASACTVGGLPSKYDSDYNNPHGTWLGKFDLEFAGAGYNSCNE